MKRTILTILLMPLFCLFAQDLQLVHYSAGSPVIPLF